ASLLSASDPQPKDGPVKTAVAARGYLEAMDVQFTTNRGGEVIAALVHCTSDLTDADMALFPHFPRLEKLNAVGPQVSDDGLDHLKDRGELAELILYRGHFTEVGMAHLKGVKKLRTLRLSRARLTDKGLEQLACVKGLECLILPANKVTPAGL